MSLGHQPHDKDHERDVRQQRAERSDAEERRERRSEQARLDERGPEGPLQGHGGERQARTATLLEELAPKLGLSARDVDVRVDADARSRTEAEGARGMMSEGRVYLHPERYDPFTSEGRYLLGHEVAHVAQQRVVPSSSSAMPMDMHHAETEASWIGRAAAAGQTIPQARFSLAAGAVAYDKGSPTGATTGKTDAPKETGPGGKEKKEQMTEAEADAEMRKIQAQAETGPKPEEPQSAKEAKQGTTKEATAPLGDKILQDASKKEGGGTEKQKQTPGPDSVAGGGEALAALDPSRLSNLPGMGELSSTLLAKYGTEKAWHDNWKNAGQPTGMAMDQRTLLVGQALGAGGLEGLTNAASAMIIDTLLNKATKSIPYAAGFIAIGQIALDPKGWYGNQKSAIWDKGLAGGAKKLFGSDSDWIDRLEGVIDILSGLNSIIGLISTICFIVAAAGFIVGLFFPVILPFVALAAKWGLLLGEINTLVGLGITLLRAVAMVARVAQIMASDADPETQMKRAEKLREQTAQATQEYSQRKMNKARQRYQERKQQQQTAAGGTQKAPGPGGGPDPAATANAQQNHSTRVSRTQRILTRMDKIAGSIAGQSFRDQAGKVGEANTSRRNLGQHIRENQGTARVDAIQNDKTTADALSPRSADRLRRHYAREEAPAQNTAAQQRLQTAQQQQQQATQQRQKSDDDVHRAEQRVQRANDELQQSRKTVQDWQNGEPGQRLAAQRDVVARAERRVPHIERQVTQKEAQVRQIRAEADAMVAAQTEIRAQGLPSEQVNRRVAETQHQLIQAESKLARARIQLQSARSQVRIEREFHQNLQTAINRPVTDAQQNVTNANSALDQSRQRQTTDRSNETTQTGNLTQAQKDATSMQQAHDRAMREGAMGPQLRSVGRDFWAAVKDTGAGFTPAGHANNLDGSQVPAAGYGHQGTGGVTGAGTSVMTADPSSTSSKVLQTLANPNAAVSGLVKSGIDSTLGNGLQDTDSEDPVARQKAIEARQVAVKAAHAKMDAEFRSVTKSLPAPPTQEESKIEESRGKYQAADQELRQVKFQLQTIKGLRPGMKADESALSAMQKLAAANQAAVAKQESDITQKEAKQGQTKAKVEEQGKQGTAAKTKQQQKADKTMAFVGKFIQLMGMVPTKIVKGAGAGAANAQKLKTGVDGMGKGAQQGEQKATQAKGGLQQMAKESQQARTTTEQGQKQLAALDKEWGTDLKDVNSGLDFLGQSEKSGEAKVTSLQKAMETQQQTYMASYNAMAGWAGEHYSLRTTGQSSVDTQLDNLEKLLDEHEAEAQKKQKALQ